MKRNIEDLSRKDWEYLIDQYIFNEGHRNILKRRLLDGITYERLAEEFDLSTKQVKNIVYKSQEKLFKHI
jgi:DNA-directed RNA polymerase sigma subunit (sigma70/sigma32)